MIKKLNKLKKHSFVLVLLAIFISTLGMTSAQMDMGNGDMQVNRWQDTVNQITFPITAVISLFSLVVCILLIKATGMSDKFGLIAVGLGFFCVQSVLGVIYYITEPNGTIIVMPDLMFAFSLLSSLGLLFIGVAFYRWKSMIA